MCFSGEMSLTFSMLGLFLSGWVYKRTSNLQLAIGVFYFFLMEFLQYFQYWFINDCDNQWNKWLTLAGYAHICYQPYFTHIINSALTKSPDKLKAWVPILRLTLIGGTMLFMRHFTADLAGMRETHFPEIGQVDNSTGASTTKLPTSTEWLRGEELCTVKGKYHLAWIVPMSDVSYYTPSAAIHSFLMFAPFFVVNGAAIQGIFLWATGPFLAATITPNLMEQASIWCFFSIAQIGIMLYIIRDVLILHWGAKTGAASLSETQASEDPYIRLNMVWPMGVVVPERGGAKNIKKKK